MSKILYFDCFSGVSGDMMLGALLDAGLPIDELRQALGGLAVPGMAIAAHRVSRAGVSATKFVVESSESHEHKHPHGHDHHKDERHGREAAHSHRSLSEIGDLIDRSALSASAKVRARELFVRLGEAEAAIHQVPLDQIHLHEVGALDSIVDIAGSVFALEWFGADRVISSPLNVGGGMVQSAHGVFPVPVPATVSLLQGVPVYSSGVSAELVTPTGALLVSAFASSYGPVPAMTISRTGYGAGDRNPPDTPNVLRVLIGESSDDRNTERVVVIECEIDDMNPQIFGLVMDRLYAAGALEVFFVPVQMKKNRPGTLLTIVASPDRRQALSALVFRETTTIGLRFHEMERERLERQTVSVDTPLGPVRFKVARLGSEVVNAAPEFDDCARLAGERGLPVKQVQAIATKAYLDGLPAR